MGSYEGSGMVPGYFGGRSETGVIIPDLVVMHARVSRQQDQKQGVGLGTESSAVSAS